MLNPTEKIVLRRLLLKSDETVRQGGLDPIMDAYGIHSAWKDLKLASACFNRLLLLAAPTALPARPELMVAFLEKLEERVELQRRELARRAELAAAAVGAEAVR
jgi:hypothetical protein